MKHTARSIIALTLLATTLCAGRAFSNGPVAGPESRMPSEKLVARLTRSFSQTVSHAPVVVQRQIASPANQPVVLISVDVSRVICLSPQQFPLPPPVV